MESTYDHVDRFALPLNFLRIERSSPQPIANATGLIVLHGW